MSSTPTTPQAGTRPAPSVPISWRTVALPVEHGGWGMLGEPAVLGLVLAPTAAGGALAAAALLAFLARHPLKLALSDWRRGARYPRTGAAERWAVGYGVGALAALALSIAVAGAPWWAYAAAAAPLALVQLGYDARNQGRQLVPELAGAIALGALAAAILVVGGWSDAVALAAWSLLALKALGSVLYVRARLRLDRGQPGGRTAPLAVHALALAVAAALAWTGAAPWLGLVVMAVLLVRAAWGLSPLHRVVRPQRVGFQEVAFGTGATLLLALGWGAGL